MIVSSGFKVTGFLRAALPVTAGVAAGVVSSLWIAHSTAPSTPHPERVSVVEVAAQKSDGVHTTKSTHTGVSPRDLTQLSDRVAAMEERLEDLPSGDSPNRDPVAMQAERKAYEEAISAKVAAQAAEPKDAVWSVEAEQTVKSEIGAFASQNDPGVELRGVDCRSSGCIATLQFPSQTEAQMLVARYVTNGFGMRCAQTAEVGSGDPAEVKVLFYDCLKDDVD
ncbi:MAG: hypothetical protein IPK82_03530 [Polyangiaceae bacterium]|nr:hypothetical protein [Polyangiaceae bacterium]